MTNVNTYTHREIHNTHNRSQSNIYKLSQHLCIIYNISDTRRGSKKYHLETNAIYFDLFR